MARCMPCFSFSLTRLDDLLDSPIGLWEPRGRGGVLDAPLVDKVLNGFPMYCGSLSLTISSGRPNRDTAFLISSVTFSLVVACRGVTMGYFEK